MNRDLLAVTIAEAVGYQWEGPHAIYEDKGEWLSDRDGRHDINTPYKADFYAAADAVLDLLGMK